MKFRHNFFNIITTLMISFCTLFVSDAYAYLDPASGSIIIQVIIGALVGVGIAAKIYWEKIKIGLSNKFRK